MPSINKGQVEYLVSRVANLRDECIIRLLFDSGMGLSEFTNIKHGDIKEVKVKYGSRNDVTVSIHHF